MTEPKRLLESSSNELERAVLRAGKSYGATDSARRATLTALGIGGASTLIASGAKAGWSLKHWLLSGVAGAAVIGSAAVGVTWISDDETTAADSSASQPAVVTTPVEVVEQEAPVDERGEKRETPSVEPQVFAAPATDSPSDEKASEPKKPTVSSTPAARADSSDGIAAELRSLDRARQALSTGNAARALSMLDAHAKEYPRGSLSLEAEVLRIQALARMGQRQAASSRAKAFLRRHPGSVFSSRVRRYVEQ